MKDIITDIEYLRQKSSNVSENQARQIVEELKSSISRAWTTGIGLAGIQIGEPFCIAWYRMPKREDVILINPEIIDLSDKYLYTGEGCLSIPNKRFLTGRYQRIKFKNNGKVCVAYDLEALVIQHEIDHMNGILCLDRAYKKPPGRNEPCICNSGKKYKKCCGG